MRREPLDFIQVDYSIADRNAANKVLPLAAERGIAVLVNLPLGRGNALSKVKGKPLPDWAKEADVTSFAQMFLKYVVSSPCGDRGDPRDHEGRAPRGQSGRRAGPPP